MTVAKQNSHTKRTAVIVALLILLAMILRNMWQFLPTNDLRGLIYIGLFTSWGISIRHRIIQVQVRRYLTAISALIVFWVVVRSIKYIFFSEMHLGRYCWYLYYFPMLFIPLLVLLVALSLGKPENYRLPGWTNLLLLVSAALFVLILTNDFHQLAFEFPKGLLYYENNDYSHELIYFISMGWMALCTVSALSVMIAKCHVPGNKNLIWLPFLPVLALIVYAVLYVTAWDYIKPIAGDMTVASCLLVTAALESCIQCHLIQSNTGYDALFRAAGIQAKISDNDYNVLLSSSDTYPLSKELMLQTEKGPVVLDNGVRICNAPIRGGHVVWLEDMSEIYDLLSQLREVNDRLSEDNDLLEAENEIKKRQIKVEEKGRLYDKVVREVLPQFQTLDALLSDETEQPSREKLKKLCVYGTYIKRRCNLLIIREDTTRCAARELEYCLRESCEALSAAGVDCSFHRKCEGEMPIQTALMLYDVVEELIEVMLPTLTSIFLNVTLDNITAEIKLLADHSESLPSDFKNTAVMCKMGAEWKLIQEDGTTYAMLRLSKGGERV